MKFGSCEVPASGDGNFPPLEKYHLTVVALKGYKQLLKNDNSCTIYQVKGLKTNSNIHEMTG